MEHVSASQDSLEFSALFQRVHHLAQATDSVCLLEPKWPASAMRATRAMIALRRRAPMTAQDMESASAVFAHARTGGEAPIALDVALDTANAAVETESALRDSATAIPAGLDMLVTCARASMTAPSTDIATMGPVCAKRDTVDAIALFLPSPNPANVPFTACVDAFNNARRSTRPRVPDHPTSATPSAHKSACPSVLLERCLSTSLEPLTFQSRPQTNSLTRLLLASSKLEILAPASNNKREDLCICCGSKRREKLRIKLFSYF